ncbi:MAG TPA: peptidyl-prolyl cis-trans isomerase [Candidatus Angelobacter sp.]|nr:peptidyl-prolyl cis-trans isomerase [Candidatus Angelobacter sp.]
MARIWMACLIAATTAFAGAQAGKNAQKPAAAPSTQSPTPPTLKKPDERPPDVLPSQPVITIKGLCLAETGPATKAAVPGTKDCAVTVTKEQFDNLLKAFNPTNQPLPAGARRQVAQAYVELLVFSEAAKAAGIENSPEYAEVMRVLRMKTLSDIYRTQLAEQYSNPSPEEIEAYYKANQSKFESAKLSRIYIPKNNPDPRATAEQKQAFQTKVQQVADDVQARAAKGEAPDKLQKEAYTTLGITAPPPSTEMTTVRHGMFPAKLDQDIFSHKAGDVFRSDDASGFVIYRIDSLQAAPLDSVKAEITREIVRHKMEDKMKELNGSVQAIYDDAYFGPPAASGAPAGAQPPNQPK